MRDLFKRAHSGKTLIISAISALILIMVTVFTIVPFTITTRSGGDATRKTNLTPAEQVMRYPADIRAGIVRLYYEQETWDLEQLKFNRPDELSKLKTNERAIFTKNAGRASYRQAAANVMANNQPGEWTFNMEISLASTETKAPDLVAYLPGIKKNICEEINYELGLPVPPPKLQVDQSSLYMKRMVTGYDVPKTAPLLATKDLNTKSFGCFISYDGQSYVYYHVLYDR